MPRRLAMALLPLLSRWLPPLWFAHLVAATGRLLHLLRAGDYPLRITREAAHFRVHCTDGSIAITDPRRIIRYLRGTTHRERMIAERYGLGDALEVLPGETIVDIGANVGEFTLAAVRTGAVVIAIEPDARTRACLTANVHGLDQVTVVDALLWECETELTFYSSSQDADSSAIEPEAAYVATVRKAIPLDVAVSSRTSEVTAIKMDAEGAEPEVLRGGPDVLSQVRTLAIDCGPERQGQRTDEAVMTHLRGLGFRTTFHSDGPHRNIVHAGRD